MAEVIPISADVKWKVTDTKSYFAISGVVEISMQYMIPLSELVCVE